MRVEAAILVLVGAVGCQTMQTAPSVDAATLTQVPPHPPPPALDAAPPEQGVTRTFAIETLHFGDALRDGTVSNSAWKTYGFDIDGKVTTGSSTDVCRLVAGAPPTTQVDGEGGIDNSFGENILPILLTTYGSNFATRRQATLSMGSTTDLFVVSGLGLLPDYDGLTGGALIAAPLGDVPSWSPFDAWPVDVGSRSGFDRAQGYMAARTLVLSSEGPGVLTLGVLADGFRLDLPLRHLTIAMHVSDDLATASDGTISAVIPTDALVALARTLAGAVSLSLCSGKAFESIAEEIAQASDILLDGTQDPTRTCDGISLGLGFEAARVSSGPDVVVPGRPDPCVDGGLPVDAAQDVGD